MKRSLGFVCSYDYCYRSLGLASGSSLGFIKDSRDSYEIPRFGGTIGLSYAFRYRKKLAFDFGILLADRGEQIAMRPLTFIEPQPTQPVAVSFIYHYQYLDLPARVHFYLWDKKVKWYLSGGLSVNIFLKTTNQQILYYEDASGLHIVMSRHKGEQLSAVNPQIMLGGGFSVDIKKHLLFKAEPTYRRSVISIENAPIRSYLWSMGLTLGCSYRW